MRRSIAAAGLAASLLAATVAVAVASEPGPPELPVLHGELARGQLVLEAAAAIPPAPKVLDGLIGDWVGEASGFGGTVVHSAGELIYTDHVFDAYGADDGRDAERLALLDPLGEAVPETYRLDPVFQADAPGQFGLDTPAPLKAEEHYGDAGFREVADLLELRVAADPDTVWVLARTTTMLGATDAAVLLLADTRPDLPAEGEAFDVPFNAGITTGTADVAILLAHGAGRAVDLATGAEIDVAIEVVANPDGYVNAIEAAIPRALVEQGGEAAPGLPPLPPQADGRGQAGDRRPGHAGRGGPGVPGALVLAAATGVFDSASGAFVDLSDDGPNLANAAFRLDEPVRTWFEKRQALALHAGSVDEFFHRIEVGDLLTGRTDSWRPGPGYHERIFVSSEAISAERGLEGIHQHYGVYVPSDYQPGAPTPLTYWLHWRGGKAHSAATVSPRIMRDFGEAGEAQGSIVVGPRGRGTSTWYLGRGHVDVNEVWDDVRALFSIDEDRVYVSGHSMGGWGSYLLSILYPDRFAAALPVAGPVTQGAWTGVDFAGCDEFRWDVYTPCYVATNDSDPRVQHTRRLLANLRNTPIGIFQAAQDELVPTSGVTRQAEELVRLGYRHRYYLFHGYEHFSHPIVDEWAEGVRYLRSHVRDPNPERVTYIRDMPFERSVEIGPSQFNNPLSGLSFAFDRAYWMSELTPANPTDGVARFDGRSLALPGHPTQTVPEAGGPASLGQVGPYTMTGLAWLQNPIASPPAAVNGFEVALSGATQVRLDLARMQIDTGRSMTGSVDADQALTLRLDGGWASSPTVTVNGSAVAVTLEDGVLSVSLPAGTSTVVIG